MTLKVESKVRKEQITEAALELFINQGVRALTVRNVAAQAGVAASSLYRHYKNKAAIVSTTLDVLFEARSDAQRVAYDATKTPMEKLRQIYFSYMDIFKRYKGLALIYFSDLIYFEFPDLGHRMREEVARGRAVLTSIIEEGQEQGAIRTDIDAEYLFISYICAYVMPGMVSSRNIHEIDLAKQAEVNWLLFEQSLKG